MSSGDVLLVALGAGGVLVAGGGLVWLMSRWLQSPAARTTSTVMGDALGNFTDVFDPGNARAARDLKDHHNAGPVTRTPDDEDDDPVRLVKGPDGRPTGIRLRPDRRT